MVEAQHSSAPEGVAVVHRDILSSFLWVSPEVTEYLGYTMDELQGVESAALVHPDDYSQAIAAWVETIRNESGSTQWRGRYRHRDGHWVWLDSEHTSHLTDGGASGYVLSTLTPTEPSHIDVHEQLRTRIELLDRLSELLPVGLLQLRGESVIECNPRLAKMLEIEEAPENLGQLLVHLIPEDCPRFRSHVDQTLSGADLQPIEVTLENNAHCLVDLRFLTGADGATTGLIGVLSDITDQVRARRRSQLAASIDALTGCLSRRATVAHIDSLIEDDEPAVAVYLDLDRFKAVNDTHGHRVGDAVLVEVVRRLRANVRDRDVVGRLGGDEFVVVCHGPHATDSIEPLLVRLSKAFANPFHFEGLELELTASIGVGIVEGDDTTDTLLDRADASMYEAKELGRRFVLGEVDDDQSDGTGHQRQPDAARQV